MGVFALEAIAFRTRSIQLANVAFGAVSITALLICVAFFWGFFMVMSGNIPAHRIRYFAPHGAVGVLSPLFYTLNICIGLDGLGTRPVSIWSVVCSGTCVVMLGVQVSMGKAVVHRAPLHIVPRHDS